jgi:hypothetical protein
MNETSHTVRLGRFVPKLDAWGASAGQAIRTQLSQHIAAAPEAEVIRLSMQGMKRIDTAFALEAIVRLVDEYRATRPICVVDLADPDITDNLRAAAERIKVAVLAWNGGTARALGLRVGSAAHQALVFALARSEVRAAEFAAHAGVSISNASSRFKGLWERGLLLRTCEAASSGGKEYVYWPVR